MTLRAVVVGAGWAGEGHTTALRGCGVEVLAVCGRTAEPVRTMADRMGIPDARTDWRSAIEELRPDIVTIATPAPAHRDIAVAAAAAGCHVVCEKPLGGTSAEAAQMLAAVDQAGVRHAYAATSRFAPGLLHARTLIDHGAIGVLSQVEVVLHLDLPPLMPYTWIHSLADGGGLLHNLFTHSLQQVLYLTGGSVQSATGWAQPATHASPVGTQLHDFRHWAPLSPAESAGCEWRIGDADLSAGVLVILHAATGRRVTMSWQGSGSTRGRHADYLAVYGTEGTLHLHGQPWVERIEHGRRGGDSWEEVPLPAVDGQGHEPAPDPIQEGWNTLMKRVIADIQGAGDLAYPTFVDGWVANEVIDIARRHTGWTPVLSRPT